MFFPWRSRLPITLLLIVAGLVYCHAQHFSTVKINVSDDETNEVVSGVEIIELSQGLSVITNESGEAILRLMGDTAKIAVFALEYETIFDTVYCPQDTILPYQLRPLAYTLNSIDITARREALWGIKKLNDIEGTSLFAGKKTEVVLLENISANLASNNARQIYAQVSGLNIYEGSEGGIQLNIGGRGLDPNRTSNFNTRQNGYDISADVLGYPESYYSPPPEMIQEIRVIRGASSLQYGTQFGGLLDFTLKSLPLDQDFRFESSISYGSFGLFAMHTGLGVRKGKISIDAFANIKRGNGFRDNSIFNAQYYYGRVIYRASAKTDLTFDISYHNSLAQQAGGLTDAQFAESPTLSTRTRNWFAVDWLVSSLKMKHTFSKKRQLSWQLSGLRAFRGSVGFVGSTSDLNANPILTLDEKTNSGTFLNPRDVIRGNFNNLNSELRFVNQYSIGNKKQVSLLGAKAYRSQNTALQGPGSLGIDADFSVLSESFLDYPNQSSFTFPNTNYALFAENIFYIHERSSITPGIRFEYINTKAEGSYLNNLYDNAGNLIFSESLKENRSFARRILLFGVGFQHKWENNTILIANLSQNYRSVTFSDIRVVSPSFIVDPNISDERGFTFDLGLRGRKSNLLDYDVTAFSLFYNDRIGIILDDRANRVRKNIGSAIIYGVESVVFLNLGKLLFPNNRNFKCKQFTNVALTGSSYLQSEDNNVVGNKVEFIPLLNVKTGLEFEHKKGYSFNIQYAYLSKQFTDAQNSERSFTSDRISGIVGDIPSYDILDVQVSKTFKKLSFVGGIDNVFNEMYFTRRATGYPGPGIIPSAGRSAFLTIRYQI